MMVLTNKEGAVNMKKENMKRREIKKNWMVNEQKISPIHTAGPVLPPGPWKEYDPFLLLMEDKFQKGAFDVHPHRGMETITFVIDGTINHWSRWNVEKRGSTIYDCGFWCCP
jgi:quercetin 2,3-dioxygenase